MTRRTLPLSCLFALALAAAAPLRAQVPPLQERLAACAACHEPGTRPADSAEYIPHLDGKPAGYLFDQLQAFRDGRRQFAAMAWLLRVLDDDALRAIAAHYAALPPRTARADVGAAPAAGADRARLLVEQGDAARGIPACSACHGTDLAGVQPGIPALTGLPADYVVAQLGAWRTGVRRARAPDCMAEIATALAPSDIRALGEWLSIQGSPAPLPPAPAGSVLPPLACGDLPHAGPQR